MSQEIQKQQGQPRDIRALLASDDIRSKVADVLPRYLTPESITRVMLATIGRTPKLAECTPHSLLNALMVCAQAGLPPDGRHAHLIPYGKEVQVIFDYKGLVMLAEKNGVENIRAAVVCDKDEFTFEIVNGVPTIHHRVNWREARGEMFAVYATCVRDGNMDVEVMQKEEVDAIRKRSKASDNGPWKTDYNEMSKKTVLRRMSKRWPLSAEIFEALSKEDGGTQQVQSVRMMPPKSLAGELFLGDAPEGEQEQEQEQPKAPRKPRAKKDEPEPEPAPQTQPDLRSQLAELMADAAVKESDLLSFLLLAKKAGFANLADIDEAMVSWLVGNWESIEPQIDRGF